MATMTAERPPSSSPMVYRWGSRGYAVPAQVVGDIVQGIIETEGVCTPERLVQEARPASSDLHRIFEWDNTRAADAYRRQQARGIIGSVRVQVIANGKPTETSAFVSVGHTPTTRGRGGGYRPVQVVIQDKDFKAEAIGAAKVQLRALRRRYANLVELGTVWSVIDALDETTE